MSHKDCIVKLNLVIFYIFNNLQLRLHIIINDHLNFWLSLILDFKFCFACSTKLNILDGGLNFKTIDEIQINLFRKFIANLCNSILMCVIGEMMLGLVIFLDIDMEDINSKNIYH